MLKRWISVTKHKRALPALGILLALQWPAGAQMGATTSSASGGNVGTNVLNNDPLTSLNLEFRSVYKQARERCSAETLPLIMCLGDNVVLIDKNLRDQVDFIPPKYTQLKVVDHVPLVLFALLNPQCDQPLKDETKQELDRIKKLVLAARPSLAGLGFDPPTLERQHQLIDRSLSFVDLVQRQQKVSKRQLVTFCRELKPMIMKNVDQAVAAQLEIIDSAVSRWKQKLGPERFKKVTVVIVSGHMPRERHTCFQYFSKALHVKREGLQIVYSEGPDDETSAREMVGMHVLDATIGETFFKDPLRMHRDLLSDGAALYLRTHPPLRAKHVR
jgi:hypothetical protein